MNPVSSNTESSWKKSTPNERDLTMNNTVKIFFTDMDDTLLNSEKQVTQENRNAIQEALLAGHKIVCNTGRPLSGFLPI